jgi:RHS repeat-associated protein
VLLKIGSGRRVQKSNGKLYWYGVDGNVMEETDATGNMTNSAFNEYVYFEGKKVARRDGAGDVFYYLDDMLGSSTGLVEIAAGQTGAVFCYDADFYPYGAEKVVTNTCPQNYKWTGKERDAETGNDDFDARYYSSVYGRFLSADWSSVPAPVPYANLTNPQTLNLYAIVSDNPESYADLDGHEQQKGSSGQCGDATSGCGGSDQNAAANTNQNAAQAQNQNAATAATVGAFVGGAAGAIVGGIFGVRLEHW